MKKSESLPSLFCKERRERIADGRSFVKSNESEKLPSLFKKERRREERRERFSHNCSLKRAIFERKSEFVTLCKGRCPPMFVLYLEVQYVIFSLSHIQHLHFIFSSSGKISRHFSAQATTLFRGQRYSCLSSFFLFLSS